jgi:two-component flavin-dependent monooxygenase
MAQHSFLAGAADAQALAAKYAAETEAARSLHPEVVEAITEAGFPRHFVPARWGGTAGTFADDFEAVGIVAEGDMAAGWCASLWASHARIAAHLPEEGQAELWGDGPTVRISTSALPDGGARRVPGGYELDGEWGFCSGVAHAEWLIVGGNIPTDGAPEWRLFLVPKGSYEILDTWYNVGLKGTGSHHVRLDGVFVPEHRTCLNVPDVRNGLPPGPDVARCHAIPYRMFNGLTFVGPVVGATRRALAETIDYLSTKQLIMGGTASESEGVQAAVARAAAAIDAAALLVGRAVAIADGTYPGSEGLPASADLEVQNLRDFAAASGMLRDAVDALFRLGGARGQKESNVTQRIWRDVNAGAGHFQLTLDLHGPVWTRHAFGVAEYKRGERW